MDFFTHFSILEDPRASNNTKIYSLELLVFIAISGVVSGFDTWTELALFAQERRDWIGKFVKVPDRMPSHDTLGNFFRRLDSKQFANCFARWASALTGHKIDDLIVLDGKTLRGSQDRCAGKNALHMINVWAGHSRIILAQHAVNGKENEITAVPELLRMIELKGALVSMDAMGCQRAIATQIIDKKADYLLAVKANQPQLLEELKTTFPMAKSKQMHEQTEKDHGRIEQRICTVMPCEDKGVQQQWKNAACYIRMEHTREVLSENRKSKEVLYFISSRMMTPKEASENVRMRWTIENNLHWTLDVTFNEDKSRIRKDNADFNMAIVRKIALNMLRKEPTPRQSLNIKRKRAGISDSFREAALKI